jgi:hypothetical protein
VAVIVQLQTRRGQPLDEPGVVERGVEQAGVPAPGPRDPNMIDVRGRLGQPGGNELNRLRAKHLRGSAATGWVSQPFSR